MRVAYERRRTLTSSSLKIPAVDADTSQGSTRDRTYSCTNGSAGLVSSWRLLPSGRLACSKCGWPNQPGSKLYVAAGSSLAIKSSDKAQVYGGHDIETRDMPKQSAPPQRPRTKTSLEAVPFQKSAYEAAQPTPANEHTDSREDFNNKSHSEYNSNGMGHHAQSEPDSAIAIENADLDSPLR